MDLAVFCSCCSPDRSSNIHVVLGATMGIDEEDMEGRCQVNYAIFCGIADAFTIRRTFRSSPIQNEYPIILVKPEPPALGQVRQLLGEDGWKIDILTAEQRHCVR